jgi:hypothetical protein
MKIKFIRKYSGDSAEYNIDDVVEIESYTGNTFVTKNPRIRIRRRYAVIIPDENSVAPSFEKSLKILIHAPKPRKEFSDERKAELSKLLKTLDDKTRNKPDNSGRTYKKRFPYRCGFKSNANLVFIPKVVASCNL